LRLAQQAKGHPLDVRVAEVLAAFPLSQPQWQPLGRGNINDTFAVTAGGAHYVLQRLNPIFQATVHFDIEAVTAHLQGKGLRTPRLQRSCDDRLWVEDGEQRAWRLFDRIDGESHARAVEPVLCREAGRLAARFHQALFDLDYTFRSARLGVHDTTRHLAHLEAMLAAHADHVAFSEARAVAQQIFDGLAALPPLEGFPPRIVHGDMKLDNIIFSAAGEALCFIDLDTVATMNIPPEMGDAFRSWCNPGGEDLEQPHFSQAHLAEALEGYGDVARGSLAANEVEGLVPATETIMLELAARFCADALAESYFAWDSSRYDAAWQHHLVRARGQLGLAHSFGRQRRDAEQLVARLLG